MKDVVLVRIDERLIHGQIMTSWIQLCNADTILIIDDESATNAFLKRILVAAAPKSLDLLIHTTKDAIEYLLDENDGKKVLVLAKTPEPLLEAIESGVKFKEINIGNMGGSAGRHRFLKNINASDSEIETIKAIINSGTEVYAQMVPSDSRVDVKSLL